MCTYFFWLSNNHIEKLLILNYFFKGQYLDFCNRCLKNHWTDFEGNLRKAYDFICQIIVLKHLTHTKVTTEVFNICIHLAYPFSNKFCYNLNFSRGGTLQRTRINDTQYKHYVITLWLQIRSPHTRNAQITGKLVEKLLLKLFSNPGNFSLVSFYPLPTQNTKTQPIQLEIVHGWTIQNPPIEILKH